jgi:hypothetical protein
MSSAVHKEALQHLIDVPLLGASIKGFMQRLEYLKIKPNMPVVVYTGDNIDKLIGDSKGKVSYPALGVILTEIATYEEGTIGLYNQGRMAFHIPLVDETGRAVDSFQELYVIPIKLTFNVKLVTQDLNDFTLFATKVFYAKLDGALSFDLIYKGSRDFSIACRASIETENVSIPEVSDMDGGWRGESLITVELKTYMGRANAVAAAKEIWFNRTVTGVETQSSVTQIQK